MIIGQAELDVRAVGTHFATDVQQVAAPGMAQVQQKGEQAAAGTGKAFRLMWHTIRDSSSGVFAPVTQLLGNVESVMDDIRAKSVALRTTAAGAATLGVGAGLQAFASKEQASQAQLSDAIDHTGHAYEEYGSQIEATVKHGEHFGVLAYQTLDVLSRLTIATNDPAKALNSYQLVLDMAATRHMSVTRAAQMLGSAYGGNTRIFRMFGINVADQNKVLADAKKADEAAATAADKLKKARQNLLDVEARIGASRHAHKASADQVASAEARVATATSAVQVVAFKHGQASPQYAAASARLAAAEQHLASVRAEGSGQTKLTVSQEIELRKAHEAVNEAVKNVTKTTAEKTTADKAAKDAGKGVDDIVAQLSQRLSGQAAASVDNFTGHLRGMTAELEDQVSTFGAKYGPAITTAGSGLMALGGLMTITQAVMSRFRGGAAEAAAAEAAIGDSAMVSAGEVETSGAAMAASGERNFGRMAAAVAGVALAIGTVAVGSATAHQGAKGGAATTLMGAVSGAAIGFSMGGPFGAAIGGAIGGLAGLAIHFRDAGSSADDLKKKVQDLADELTTALSLDKGLAGANTQQVFTSFLQKNPEFAHHLSQYGVSMNDLVAYAKGGKESSHLEAAFGAANAGSFGGQKGRETFINDLNSLLQAYGSASDLNTDISSITGNAGKGTYNRKYPGMPAGWHPPMAVPFGYSGPGAGLAGTGGQLTSIHVTLQAIQHNTQKTAHHAKDTHDAIVRSGSGKPLYSPSLATL